MNPSKTTIRLALVLAVALALTVVPGATPAAKPLLKLGPIPGTTSVVTVVATDTSGTTVKKTATPAFVPPSSMTVSAGRAVGLRIAKVRFVRKGSARTHRIRLTVTVKDKRGRLVRGAKISVRSARAGRLVRQPRASRSLARGRATFVLRLRKAAFGKRLVVVTVAKTPRAKATRRAAVLVPRRAPARR